MFRHNKIRIASRRLQKELTLPRGMRRVFLRVRGRDNTIRLLSPEFHGSVSVCGKDNTLVIEEGVRVGRDCHIRIGLPGAPCFGATVIIGRNTFLGEVDIRTAEDDSRVEIGPDCMFSFGVKVWGTDGHALRHADGSLNVGRSVIIGRHVWVGADVRIGKNTVIADDCVVGWGSTVSHRFTEPACTIAGSPAQQISSGITWDADLVSRHMENARIHRERDWDVADRAPLWQRPILHLRRAWFRHRLRRATSADKREKYARILQRLTQCL